MKILELNFEKGWRGGERQTLLSALHFREAGHQVALLARAGQPLAKAAREQGLTVHELERSAQIPGFLARQGRDYDLLHSQTANMLTWCILTRWAHRRPVVCSRRVAFALGSRFTRYKYRKADRVVAISQAAAAALREAGVRQIEIIPSAVSVRPPDLERARAFVEQHQLQGRKIVATMAALTTDKDPLTTVEALRLVLQQRDDFVFVHFGAGPMQEEVQAAVRRAGLEQHYVFAGFHSNPEDYYAMMDVFVLGSREEGLGSSVLDALARGVPAAATAAGGLREVLADGRGLLSPVGDAAALADNLVRLLSDAPADVRARDAMVAAGKAWVERECNVQIMGDRYLALFEKLLDRA